MPHANAPLTPEGRRRLCERVAAGRPIAHVAAEAQISRRCLAKWYGRWVEAGEFGPSDRLPTETDIVQELGVARMTVRKAVGVLRDEGLVYTVHAQGTFVSRDRG